FAARLRSKMATGPEKCPAWLFGNIASPNLSHSVGRRSDRLRDRPLRDVVDRDQDIISIASTANCASTVPLSELWRRGWGYNRDGGLWHSVFSRHYIMIA